MLYTSYQRCRFLAITYNNPSWLRTLQGTFKTWGFGLNACGAFLCVHVEVKGQPSAIVYRRLMAWQEATAEALSFSTNKRHKSLCQTPEPCEPQTNRVSTHRSKKHSYFGVRRIPLCRRDPCRPVTNLCREPGLNIRNQQGLVVKRVCRRTNPPLLTSCCGRIAQGLLQAQYFWPLPHNPSTARKPSKLKTRMQTSMSYSLRNSWYPPQ